MNVAATAHFAGVLLDAPFDDLVPLAERIVPSMLPAYFLPFTEVVLRRHYNLDVAAQLSGATPVACTCIYPCRRYRQSFTTLYHLTGYTGPVVIVRR